MSAVINSASIAIAAASLGVQFQTLLQDSDLGTVLVLELQYSIILVEKSLHAQILAAL
jgi:hypothetical protein